MDFRLPRDSEPVYTERGIADSLPLQSAAREELMEAPALPSTLT